MSYSHNFDYSYLNKKSLEILIVDDDTNASELFKKILESHGHVVKTLDEGVKCISNCIKKHYDIIFLDYHIRDINGIELTGCLKDVLLTKSLIYAYTIDLNPEVFKKCKDIGMDGVIIKPLNINNINKILLKIKDNNKKNNKFNIFL